MPTGVTLPPNNFVQFQCFSTRNATFWCWRKHCFETTSSRKGCPLSKNRGESLALLGFNPCCSRTVSRPWSCTSQFLPAHFLGENWHTAPQLSGGRHSLRNYSTCTRLLSYIYFSRKWRCCEEPLFGSPWAKILHSHLLLNLVSICGCFIVGDQKCRKPWNIHMKMISTASMNESNWTLRCMQLSKGFCCHDFKKVSRGWSQKVKRPCRNKLYFGVLFRTTCVFWAYWNQKEHQSLQTTLNSWKAARVNSQWFEGAISLDRSIVMTK